MELTLLDTSTEWTEHAQCRGTTQRIFFPTQEYYEGSPNWSELVSIAKSICGVCEVKRECLSYALETHQDQGIWGGLTPNERTRRRRRSA